MCVYIVIGYVVCQSTTFFLLNIFQCTPVSFFWTRIPPGSCIDRSWLFISALANLVADLLVLGLPIPVIWSLQLTTRKKIAVCGVLFLGAV